MPTIPSTIALPIALAAALLLPGCSRYQVGAESLYAFDVQTVYVPMVESNSFRRDLGERLTEAIVKEIELKTPFKVVNSPVADSVLRVRLTADRRQTLAEDPFDQPRLLENQVVAEVSWVNVRRAQIAASQGVAPQFVAVPTELAGPEAMLAFRQDSELIPAAGRSVVQTQQEAIQRLAEQIVSSMEEPW